MKKVKFGIIGIGVVGSAWAEYLLEKEGYAWGRDLFGYDIDPQKRQDDVNLADIIAICVPTPPTARWKCDLSAVESSVAKIKDSKCVVIVSTVPPGTTVRLQIKYPDKYFIRVPEFLTERKAKTDFRNPSRVIIAPACAEAFKYIDAIKNLMPLARGITVPGPVNAWEWLEANSIEAEFVKYFGNIMGAMKVTLSEMFNLAERIFEYSFKKNGIGVKIDHEVVTALAGADYRIGKSHLKVGCGGYNGYGGSCFIKDTLAFARTTLVEMLDICVRSGRDLKLIEAVKGAINFIEAMDTFNACLFDMQNIPYGISGKHEEDLKWELANLQAKGELKTIEDYLID